jgi:hypothetical protein
MCLLNIMLFFVISRRKAGDVCHQITFSWMNAFFFWKEFRLLYIIIMGSRVIWYRIINYH